jgi:hypothetical protein
MDGVDSGTLNNYITSCSTNDPCAASWQAAYVWHADQTYRLAVYQALQQVAFGALEFASNDRAADQQYDIADRQMRIAEEEYARYKANYVECEDALAAEICAMECPEADYDTRADRATRDVRKQMSIARGKMERMRNRYCAHDTMVTICNMEKAEAMAVVVARDAAYRYEESYRDLMDEKRWSRRLAILQHGRNIMSGQSSLYDSGAGQASAAIEAARQNRTNLFGTLSGAVGNLINAGAARRQAYYRPEPMQSTARPTMATYQPLRGQSGVAPFQGNPIY